MQFFAAIRECGSIEELGELFQKEIAAEGFSASSCCTIRRTVDGPEPRYFFDTWPDGWRALYQRDNLVASDYIIAEACKRFAPFTWREAQATRDLTPAERAYQKAASARGWRDGFAVPIHGPACYFALVIMGGEARELSDAARRHLHMLALAAHEHGRTLPGARGAAGHLAPLSVRELECLRCVGAGMTDPQIASALEISTTTVKTYVDAARKKLAARTRAHAITRMALCGLG